MDNASKNPVKRILTVLCGVCTAAFVAHAATVENPSNPDFLKQYSIRIVDNRQVLEVSMRDLLSLALERATAMKTIKLNRQIAEESLQAARESNNPAITNSVKAQKSIGGSLGDEYYMKRTSTDITSLGTALSQKLDNGITYGFGISESTSRSGASTKVEKSDSFGDSQSLGDILISSSISASVDIPLYQGWGDINRLNEFQSEIGLEQTTIGGQKSTQDLLHMIAGIYWDLVGILKTIESLESNVKLSKQFLDDNKVRHNLGLLDIIEVKQSESQLARVRQTLLQEQVEKKQVEDRIRAALKLEELPIGYLPIEELKVKKIDTPFNELLAHVFETDHELQRLNTQLKLNGLAQKSALDSDKPDIDLQLGYTMHGFGKSRGEPLEESFDRDSHGYSVGLTWKIPLFDRVTPQKIQEAILDRSKIDIAIQDRKTQLHIELQAVLRNLQLAEEGIKLAEISTSLAQDLLEKEVEKFKLGDSTGYRVSRARQDLSDAQKEEIAARINFEKTFLSFLTLTNRLMEHYRLQ